MICICLLYKDQSLRQKETTDVALQVRAIQASGEEVKQEYGQSIMEKAKRRPL